MVFQLTMSNQTGISPEQYFPNVRSTRPSEDRSDTRANHDAVILLTRTLALWGFNKYLTSFVFLAALQIIVGVTIILNLGRVCANHGLFSLPNSLKFIMPSIIGSHFWNVGPTSESAPQTCC